MSSLPRNNGKGRANDGDIRNPIIRLVDPAPGEDPSLAIHPGVVCSGPNCPRRNQYIHGVRYNCMVCKHQDFCRACIGQPDTGHDTSHEVLECIGPSEIDIVRLGQLTNGARGFEQPATDGLQELLELNGLRLSGESDELSDLMGLQPTLRPSQGPNVGSPLVEVEHYQDQILLASVEAGQMTRYDYNDCRLTSLPGNQPAIARLLALKPGQPGDKVEVQFQLTRLVKTSEIEVPEYEVVCCKWRDLSIPSDRKLAVYVGDDHFLEVSIAVVEALQAFRDPVETKLLWIEDLCIDPAHEKRFQNRSRGLIISRASNAVIWAGEYHDDLEDATALMMQLSHYCNRRLLTPDNAAAEPDLPPFCSGEWQALFSFFNAEVSRCHWDLEDISFAEKAELRCGNTIFNWWDDIAGILRTLSQPCWSLYLQQ